MTESLHHILQYFNVCQLDADLKPLSCTRRPYSRATAPPTNAADCPRTDPGVFSIHASEQE